MSAGPKAQEHLDLAARYAKRTDGAQSLEGVRKYAEIVRVNLAVFEAYMRLGE